MTALRGAGEPVVDVRTSSTPDGEPGRIAIVVAAPSLAVDGQLIGVVVIDVAPAKLGLALTPDTTRTGGRVYMVDMAARVIAQGTAACWLRSRTARIDRLLPPCSPRAVRTAPLSTA